MVKHTYCSAQRCSKIGKNGGNLKVGKANGWICKHSQVCWQNQVHDLNVRSIWFWSVSVNAWLKVLSCWEAPFCRSVAFQCEKQKLEELFSHIYLERGKSIGNSSALRDMALPPTVFLTPKVSSLFLFQSFLLVKPHFAFS